MAAQDMDPLNPSSFNHRTERLTTGRTYHFVDQVPPGYNRDTPTVLLIHGFPDLWYGWRHQIGPWARKGWRIVVPDCLGYGGTDKPSELSPYAFGSLCRDLVALLDCIGVAKVVAVGHDWGAVIAWRFCLYFPLRVSMVACLSVPYFPPAQSFVPLEDFIKVAPEFAYQLYFVDEASTKEIENNLELFFNLITYSDAEKTRWAYSSVMRDLIRGETEISVSQDLMSSKEFEFYLKSFKNSLAGPLSYYKTWRLRFEEEKEANLPSDLPASLPALFVRGTADPTSPERLASRSKNFVPSLKIINLDGAGHWLMMERRDEVTSLVGDWIENALRGQVKL